MSSKREVRIMVVLQYITGRCNDIKLPETYQAGSSGRRKAYISHAGLTGCVMIIVLMMIILLAGTDHADAYASNSKYTYRNLPVTVSYQEDGENAEICSISYNSRGLIREIKITSHNGSETSSDTHKYNYTYYKNGAVKSVRTDAGMFQKAYFNKYGTMTRIYYESDGVDCVLKGTPKYYKGSRKIKILTLKGKDFDGERSFNASYVIRYDKKGRITSVIMKGKGKELFRNTMQYNSKGQITKYTKKEGNWNDTTTYVYKYNGTDETSLSARVEVNSEDDTITVLNFDRMEKIKTDKKTLKAARYMTPIALFTRETRFPGYIYEWK